MYNEEIRNIKRRELNIENNFVLCNIGRISWEKNQIYLIDLFKKICEKNENSRLLLVGDGPEKENVLRRVKELNLEDKVKFLGVTDNVSSILQCSDVFLFPSLFEGLGIAAVEAQCSNLPVIMSDNVPQETKFNKDVYYINLNNEKEWIEKTLEFQNYDRNYKFDVKSNIYNIKNEAQKLIFILKEMRDNCV